MAFRDRRVWFVNYVPLRKYVLPSGFPFTEFGAKFPLLAENDNLLTSCFSLKGTTASIYNPMRPGHVSSAIAYAAITKVLPLS
jgi:hypothetical protein